MKNAPDMASAMEALQGQENDTRFDTGGRIIINGVRAEQKS